MAGTITSSVAGSRYNYCQGLAHPYGSQPGFLIQVAVQSLASLAGDLMVVKLVASTSNESPVYSVPQTYSINWTGLGTYSPLDDVEIDAVSGTAAVPLLQMWEGTITVAAGEQAVAFSGTHLVDENGMPTVHTPPFPDAGTISGSVTCPPGAMQG